MQPQNPDQLRLFIAIRMPDAVKSEIGKAQAELRKAAPEARIRWTTRDQFHLTLRFLGDVAAQRVEPLTQAIKRACQGFSVLRLRAERVGFFPDARFPRVVWAGVHDLQERLPALQSAVQEATREFTAEEPIGNFTGHVTLGRIKGIRQPEADSLAKAAASLSAKSFGEWPTTKVELIRSALFPSGARIRNPRRGPVNLGLEPDFT